MFHRARPAARRPALAGRAAELGVGAFYRAFDRWADPACLQTLTELTREALGQLRAATATLG